MFLPLPCLTCEVCHKSVSDILTVTEYLLSEKLSQIGLSASTIASSFGKAISENKNLEDYRPEDISLSLLRMISYNIGQVSCLKALFSSCNMLR